MNLKTVSHPHNLKIKLFAHQLASIYKMERFESNNIIQIEDYAKETKIGINCNLPGFGKTLEMIGLIIRNKMDWDINVPFVFENILYNSNSRIKIYKVKRFIKLDTTLILVQNNILSHWENELNYSCLKYTRIQTRDDIDAKNISDYDVILVIPEMYNKLTCEYSQCAWKRFIFDEPQSVKIKDMNEIHAGFYWFVTSTPKIMISINSQTCTGFMKSILDSDFIEHLEDISIQNDIEIVKKSFKMPEIDHFYYKCYQPFVNVVSNYITPSIKLMIEAGNIEEAITNLGGTKTSNIYELIKTKKESEIEFINVRINMYKIRNNSKDIKTVKELEEKKIHIETQLVELQENFNEMLKQQCSICFEDLNSPVLESICCNIFCGKCFLTWVESNSTCPLCRCDIDVRKITYIKDDKEINYDKEINAKTLVKKITKNEKILEIVRSNTCSKVLIFSQFSNSFKTIQKQMKENNIEYLEMKGSHVVREKNLEIFKNGDINNIFISGLSNIYGLNLKEVTDIIMYHDIDICSETQLIGRVNRIGRKIELRVHHLQIEV